MNIDDVASTRAEQARKQSPFLTTDQAATYVGLSRRTLEKMRTAGTGPVFRKHGRYVRYHIADLDTWSAERSKHSTAEPDSHRRRQRSEHAPTDRFGRANASANGQTRPRS